MSPVYWFIIFFNIACFVLLLKCTKRWNRLQRERELAKAAAFEQNFSATPFDASVESPNSNSSSAGVNYPGFSSGSEEDAINISRSELTALNRMMNRSNGNQSVSSPSRSRLIPSVSPAVPVQPVISTSTILFPMPVRHAQDRQTDDLPPAYDELLRDESLLSKNAAPPEYSVYVIPSDHLPPPPQYSPTFGIR